MEAESAHRFRYPKPWKSSYSCGVFEMRSGGDWFIGWSSVALVLLVGLGRAEESLEPSGPLEPQIGVQIKDGWTIAESPNFRCRCQLPEADARRLAVCCETWRARLRKVWLSEPDDGNWRVKCEVQLHSNRDAYNHTLNRAGDTSVGSTMIRFDQGRPVLRKIDVRRDASDWSNAALPHELTHVILADRFGGRALPRWADEGIAMLSESQEKHRERLVNLKETLRSRPTFRITDLTLTQRLPGPQLRDAFYGQSVGLVSLLVRRSTPARFADFLLAADRLGLDRALREHYQLDGVAGLQHQWDQWAGKAESMDFVSLQLQSGPDASLASRTDREAVRGLE